MKKFIYLIILCFIFNHSNAATINGSELKERISKWLKTQGANTQVEILDNIKLTNLPIHERSRLGISYLPQQTSIFRGLTVYENLLGIAQILKKSNEEQRDMVEKLMAEFSITHLRDVKATSLSGGERRRTEIARCLISNPKVLLLDEPFAGVDLLSIQDIKGLLLKLQARGCAVLVTDHNASQLLSVVDRAYVIANGSIVANGTPRQIVNTSEAKKLYFGEDFTF